MGLVEFNKPLIEFNKTLLEFNKNLIEFNKNLVEFFIEKLKQISKNSVNAERVAMTKICWNK